MELKSGHFPSVTSNYTKQPLGYIEPYNAIQADLTKSKLHELKSFIKMEREWGILRSAAGN